jgi:hypothetical protein
MLQAFCLLALGGLSAQSSREPIRSAAELEAAIHGAAARAETAVNLAIDDSRGWFSDAHIGKALEGLGSSARGAHPWYQSADWTSAMRGSAVELRLSLRYKLPPDVVLAQAQEALEEARAIALEAMASAGDPSGVLLSLHDAIASMARYDQENFKRGTVPPESYTPYGALVEGRAVCDGFSKAFLLAAGEAGLECRFIKGQGNGGPHSWNLVRLNGTWYHLDITFDLVDPPYLLSYGNFLVDDALAARDHSWDRTAYPACPDPTMDLYSRAGASLVSLQDVAPFVRRIASKGVRIDFRVRDFDPAGFGAGLKREIAAGLVSGSWSFNYNQRSGAVILLVK